MHVGRTHLSSRRSRSSDRDDRTCLRSRSSTPASSRTTPRCAPTRRPSPSTVNPRTVRPPSRNPEARSRATAPWKSGPANWTMRKRCDYLVLSLGTGELNARIRYEDAKRWGTIHWARPLIDIAYDGSSDIVDGQMRQLMPVVKRPYLYYRFQASLSEANNALDDTSDANMQDLKRRAEVAVRRPGETGKNREAMQAFEAAVPTGQVAAPARASRLQAPRHHLQELPGAAGQRVDPRRIGRSRDDRGGDVLAAERHVPAGEGHGLQAAGSGRSRRSRGRNPRPWGSCGGP